MKSKTELKREIKKLQSQAAAISDKDPNRKQKGKAISNELEFLNTCLHYLETNPKKDFIQRQYDAVLKQLDVIGSGYANWRDNQPLAKVTTYQIYEREMGVSKLKNQKKHLDFILN